MPDGPVDPWDINEERGANMSGVGNQQKWDTFVDQGDVAVLLPSFIHCSAVPRPL